MKFLSATEWLFYNLWTYNPSSNFNNNEVKIAGSLIFRYEPLTKMGKTLCLLRN